MKKNLFLLLSALLVGFTSYGQKELVKGGNMEDPSAWNVYWNTFDAVDTGTYEFNYTTDGPTAGVGGCYRVTAAGQAANMLWQTVTLIPGHKYEISGAYKYLADTAVNVWVELFLTRIKPAGGGGSVTGEIATGIGYSLNTWVKADTVNLDGTFQDNFPLANTSSKIIEIPDTVTQTEWYLAFKAGCWNSVGDVTPVYDLSIDEISLKDVSVVSAGGSMEDPSAWNAYWNIFDAVDTGTYEFNYTADVPAAGQGGCYRVTAAGQAANMLWQPVTIIPGHKYMLTGAYKYIADTAVNVWVEYFITRIKPAGGGGSVTGEIATGMGYSLNTWMKADTVNFDGTFQDNFSLANTSSKIIQIPDTVTQTEWYLALKAGCWNSVGDVTPVYDLLFDELYMTDMGPDPYVKLPIENIVFGTVDNAADYTGQVSMMWDADSLYMIYDVVDDSIVTEGASYQVDNIEVYIDMDNSKNVHYPRNGGWTGAVDAAFDANDYQLRLVPGIDFATNNSARPAGPSIAGGYNQIYTETADGYQFKINIAWDSLLLGYVPEGGKSIGFDVLVSDNDAVASDPNRNQITLNAPNTNPYNDPSIWGELLLSPSGSFYVVTDEEKPTNPTNVVATVADVDVTLSWDASTDNRVVQSYILFNGNVAVDTILAKETGNTFKFKGLEAGDYTFGVTAMDIYGNKSTKVTATASIVIIGVETTSVDMFKIYPNPSNGVLNITAANDELVTIEVYNISGSRIASDVFTSNYKLELSQGVYFIHMKSSENTQVTKVLVK